MKLVVISPEADEPREHAVLAELFAAGLERYHVRKPQWPQEKLAVWLNAVPSQWWSRLVLHQHHELAVEFGCGGMHFKDSDDSDDALHRRADFFTSRSCHDLADLNTALGNYAAVFFSPVFPSISKSGYGPTIPIETVTERLARRTDAERKTEVIALGGITPTNAIRCAELGFDGVAVLGALWQALEPLKVFEQLQSRLGRDASPYLTTHHVA